MLKLDIHNKNLKFNCLNGEHCAYFEDFNNAPIAAELKQKQQQNLSSLSSNLKNQFEAIFNV